MKPDLLSDYAASDKPMSLQQCARLKFEALIADVPVADAAYNALPETHGGCIISTDLARFLDDRYQIHVPGTLRDLVPSWDSAWVYAQDRLEREIKNRRGRKILRLMAGGWSAGKTHALNGFKAADLSWDGTLADAMWATKIIELALRHGWKVQIAYVQRPLALACQGALDRGVSEGRMVPLIHLPKVHAQVQKSIETLHRLFSRQERVRFRLLYNPGTPAHNVDVSKLRIRDIAPGGELHYSDADVKAFEQTARQIWQEAKDRGDYPPAVIEAAGQDMG